MPESLTDQQRDDLTKLLGAPIFFPDEYKTWITDFVATNIPLIPYTQFLGARMNLARSGNFVATAESTTSSSYVDLATVGPTIAGIADGDYLVMFGGFVDGQGGLISYSVNGAAASDSTAVWENDNAAALSRADIVTLKNNHNSTIQLKYRKDGGAGPTFSRRWIVVIRISTG